DTQANQNMIEHYAGLNMNDFNLLRVTPFDAQSLPNQSSQLYDTYIGLWIDGLDEIEIREIVNSLFQYIQHK
ncbi:accessory Sec system protein Asp1, partial [Staphylococcus epidermidis]